MSSGKWNLFCRLKNCQALLGEEKRRVERLRQRIEELEADAELWEQHGLAETVRERDRLRQRIEELEADAELWEQHGLAETVRERDRLRQRIEELEEIVDGLRGDNEFLQMANDKACNQVESLQKDAELGRLVRQMPEDFCLSHVSSKQVGGTWFCWRAGTGPEWPEWDKLVAALRETLPEEQDE